jgi:hypothetical protein
VAADAAKGCGIGCVAFRADQLPIRRAIPKISARRTEERPSQGAKGTNQLAGIAVLQRGARELKQQPLKRLIGLRLIAGTRVSDMGIQWSPITS